MDISQKLSMGERKDTTYDNYYEAKLNEIKNSERKNKVKNSEHFYKNISHKLEISKDKRDISDKKSEYARTGKEYADDSNINNSNIKEIRLSETKFDFKYDRYIKKDNKEKKIITDILSKKDSSNEPKIINKKYETKELERDPLRFSSMNDKKYFGVIPL